jgi:hypothetical protein
MPTHMAIVERYIEWLVGWRIEDYQPTGAGRHDLLSFSGHLLLYPSIGQ